MTGECDRCGRYGPTERHHRKLRSQLGDDSEQNLVDICAVCHRWAHDNPAEAYRTGWMVKSWDEPSRTTPQQLTTDGREIPHEEVVSVKPSSEPAPGTVCEACHRRIPHAKKPTSPKTKTSSIRVPIDDVETWEETLDAAAEHAGLLGKPHHKFWTITKALALLLQAPKSEFE